MKIAGIVAEYNPFHKGHAYQIEKIREKFGVDTGIVCVMSGDFVQRGEPAIFSKYARAEAAVRCGVDLVLELPLQYSIASAEGFADGAVRILGGLGVVDYLVFGSESADLEAIMASADTIGKADYEELLRETLKQGCSYPTARAQVLGQMTGKDLVGSPNDNLGVEYVRAIRRNGFSMEPVVVRREGAMHDTVSDEPIKSGSELRQIAARSESLSEYVPDAANAVYRREQAAGRGPMFVQALEQGILARLRMLPEEAFVRLPDASEGLENRLYHACRTQTGLYDIYDTVKSKRYTHARIRRMTMCAALGITKADYMDADLYGRVLALNERGGRILRKTDGVRSMEIISKPSVARGLLGTSGEIFEKTAAAHDLYVLGYSDPKQRMGEMDWKTSPVYVR